MAKDKVKKPRKAKKPPVRPNSTTFKIVAVGLVCAGLIWFFFVRPAQADNTAALEESEAAEMLLDGLNSEIASFREGTSFSISEVDTVLGPASRLLPSDGKPGDTVSQIQELAAAAGVELDAITFTDKYVPGDGATTVSEVTMQASGTTDQLVAWVSSVHNHPQLITVSTSELSVDPATGRVKMPVTVSVWGTSLDPFTP